jgi:hypothetical protein
MLSCAYSAFMDSKDRPSHWPANNPNVLFATGRTFSKKNAFAFEAPVGAGGHWASDGQALITKEQHS